MKKITDLTLQSLSEAQKKEIKGGRWKIEAIHVGAGAMGQECQSKVYMINERLFGRETQYAVNED